jgi:C_GCAxxG_C_C family probable redox protein
MLDRAAQRSNEFWESGFYCAESVLLALAEEQEIQSDLIPRIATGFCSGVARSCGMCGAVSGAILGLSLCNGRNSPDESVDDAYAIIRELMGLFVEKFGSINCQELIGCDLDTDEGQEFFRANNLHEQCGQYVEEAARMAMQLMEG